jgi:hypothetical protein
LDGFIPALDDPHWLEALQRYWAERMFGPFDPPEIRSRVLADLERVPSHLPGPLFRSIFGSDFAGVVREAPCPLLFIHAGIPADLERLRELRPDAIVASVVASGHFVALVVPEQIAVMIERFIDVLPLAREEGRPAARTGGAR